MMKVLVLFILSFLSFGASSQDSVLVQVTVLSRTEQETVQNVIATIKVGETTMYKNTNMKGELSFKAKPGSTVEFKFSHAQFASSSEYKRIDKSAEDTVDFVFEMEFLRTKDLNEIVVSAPGVAVKVYKSNRLHVADFELQNDGNILLLTYPKRLKKGSELIIFDGYKDLINFQVPDKANELIRDFRGNPHVVCDEMVYGIQYNGSVVEISQIPKNYYTTYIAPIVDTNQSIMYFSNFNPDYPAFDYYTYDQIDSTYKKIMQVKDELMMELYRSEYKWVDVRTKLWARQMEMETGVDAEIHVGANYFTQSLYYKEVYAPLFQRNDSLFLFDYYKDKLFTFNKLGAVIDSVEMYHHYNPKSTGWEKKLIQDRETGQIYAVFERAGYTYLGHIDTNTGEITEQVKLEHRYIDKVAVQGNAAYYIYREFESTQKRMLWREGLPYKFRKSKTPEGDELEEVSN